MKAVTITVLAFFALVWCIVTVLAQLEITPDLAAAPLPSVAPRPLANLQAFAKPVVVHAALAKPLATVPRVEACETILVKGSHTSRSEEEARSVALNDAADICPAGQVTPRQVRCEAVDGELGVAGYPARRCVQEAACTLCGDTLRRHHEANR